MELEDASPDVRAILALAETQPGYGALGITPDDRVVWPPLVDGIRIPAE